MIKKITLLFCVIKVFSCIAQSNYHTLIDTSNVAYRDKIKALYNERAAQTLLSFKKFPDKKISKALTESYTELNSEFTDKVNNGLFIESPLYEDRINTLFKKIVAANPQYAALATTRILLSFSEVPNASAIGDDFVVVNLSLLANLKEEDELAFILCHELAHNLLNHPQNGLMEYVKIQGSQELKKQTREIEKKKYYKIENASGLYKKIIYANKKKHREIEFQADSLGFILYKNAFAGREAIALKSFTTMDSMDKEKDSLQPKDYEKLFSSEKQPFKKEWILADEISIYKYDKALRFWQIDSLKSHPDCIDRANRLKTIFRIEPENENFTNLDYQNIIRQAQYDDILGLYVLKEYGKSLYQALLLLKDNPGNSYLKNMVYSNLIKIQDAQKNYTMNKYVETMNPRYSHSYNTFLSFLRQLRKSEITEITNQYQ
jgi:hypothetical protein